MANEIYRTYEVLVEESIHLDNPKRQRTKKEPRHNAAASRALQTTNDVFQDAVCYYLFLIIGLLCDVPETERDEINPLWRTLNGPLKSKVEDVLKRLNDKYPVTPWHSSAGALDLMTFLSKTYCVGLNLTKETMQATYGTLKNEASKKKKNKATGNYDVVEGELDLGMFPQTWIGLLTNESKRLMKTIGGEDWSAPYLPKKTSSNRPLFPAFSNCLGIELSKGSKTVWRELDKNAFSKAAEEVFKYKIRSDKRRNEYNAKKGKVAAMEGDGNWTYEVERSGQNEQKTKQLGGIRNDIRAERIKTILEEIGGGIGYGVSRSTIGGWRDLRETFLKAETKKGEDLSSDDLEEFVTIAQTESAGGFGSAALFKKLCEPENWCVWQDEWKGMQDFHPPNFLFWYARYGEAKKELDALEEKDDTNNLKPISITLPGTANC